MTKEEAIEILTETQVVYFAPNGKAKVQEALNMAIEALSAEAVGDAISKKFISDAILQKISELNAQGEKAIPIAREFIRFKRFVDGITPIRADADRPQGEWEFVDSEIFAGEYFCSICGKRAEVDLYGEWILSNYCPSCGAKIKGGDSE